MVLVAGFAVAGVIAGLVATRGDDGGPRATSSAPQSAKVVRIIFPEGFTRAEMAERVAAVREIARERRGLTTALTLERYLSATASSALPGRFAGDGKRRSLEGFLFPATYAFFADEGARSFVNRQLAAFDRAWAQVDLGYATSKNLTRYDVLIIASMVEEEISVPSERPLAAAVIYNRLRARMPLGIDATLRYGLGIPPTRSITKSDLASDSPYNTRRFKGLPPTPIANPGLASIEAAAHPAQVPYLYYARKPGTTEHYFTASAEDFQRFLRENGYAG
jgi:UPF0755 protein